VRGDGYQCGLDWGLSSSLKAFRHGSHSFTCKLHHACLFFVSIHQMALPLTEAADIQCSLLLIYRPPNDDRLSWPGWLTYSGWFSHICGHPSATGRAQDKKTSPAKDRCSTVVLRNQPTDQRQGRILDLGRGFVAGFGVESPFVGSRDKTTERSLGRKSSKFLYMLAVAAVRSSADDSAILYALFSFMDGVIFAHNGL